MSELVFIIAGGVALFLIGLGLGFWGAKLRGGKEVAKAADVQKQFDDYRQSVTDHFGRTAEHFQTIGQQYRELYEHMASGADALIDQQVIGEKLSFVPKAENEATESEVEDVEPAAQGAEDSDESQRTYH